MHVASLCDVVCVVDQLPFLQYIIDCPSPQEEDVEVMSGSSGYEGFVATRSLVMFLPHRQWTQSNNKGKNFLLVPL